MMHTSYAHLSIVLAVNQWLCASSATEDVMNKAQRVIARIKTGGRKIDHIDASDYVSLGSFEGHTSYYFEDGSRVWTNGPSCGAAPNSGRREANHRPRG